jgi:serine/threonine protein kinase
VAGIAFGRYRVLGELGRGAMAVVYLAEDTQLERRVALKVLTEQYANNEGFRERFRREGRILARAQHDCIVPIFDSGEHQGTPYLVMKLMPGGTLADRVAAGPVDPQRAMPILSRIATALDAAHASGVIHRDLKPANVLFDERDLSYVGDFGVGRLDGAASGVTQPGTVIGTAQYMSPEQIQGGAANRLSDIYSFAALAFETLTGAPPYPGTDVWSVMRAHLEAPVPRPSATRPWLGFADGPLMMGLAKRPEQRPQTASALVEMLLQAYSARAAQPVAAPPPQGQRHSTLPAATPPPVVKAPARRKNGGWQGPVILAAVGAAIAALVVSVVISQLSGGGDNPPVDDDDQTATATRIPEDEATPTPTGPGPSPTPTSTPRPETGGTVFIGEDFSNAAQSRVASLTDSAGIVVVANGELQMIDTADDGFLVSRQWDTGKADVSLRMRLFANEGYVTLACRDDGASYEVRASVSSRDGQFKTWIYYYSTGTFSTYIDWTESDLIKRDAKVTVELLCVGNLMEFVIEGVTVASHTIEGTTGTGVWFGADGGLGANVFIDDLRIATLN